jgi:DNA-binding transcriptional MerR regulator
MLAKRTGTSVPTIRYYEQIGLLRRPMRSGGQRIYDNETVRRLAFVRRCREFDFSIEEVRSLLALMQNGKSCTEARNLAEGHLVALRRKLVELKALERRSRH